MLLLAGAHDVEAAGLEDLQGSGKDGKGALFSVDKYR